MTDLKVGGKIDKILLRPHHGLCIQHFMGNGYSEEFVENMTRIIAELKKDPEMEITLHSGTDILCASCPYNGKGQCESGQKVAGYDKRVLEHCGLNDGETLSWKRFSTLVRFCIMEKGQLPQVCSGCQWLYICNVVK